MDPGLIVDSRFRGNDSEELDSPVSRTGQAYQVRNDGEIATGYALAMTRRRGLRGFRNVGNNFPFPQSLPPREGRFFRKGWRIVE